MFRVFRPLQILLLCSLLPVSQLATTLHIACCVTHSHRTLDAPHVHICNCGHACGLQLDVLKAADCFSEGEAVVHASPGGKSHDSSQCLVCQSTLAAPGDLQALQRPLWASLSIIAGLTTVDSICSGKSRCWAQPRAPPSRSLAPPLCVWYEDGLCRASSQAIG